MTDTFWRERLDDLADADDAATFDVGADLERGRRRLRRRRVGELGAGLLVAAVVVGGAMAFAPGPGTGRADPGPAASSTPAPTFQEPETTLAPVPSAAATTSSATTASDAVRRVLKRDGGSPADTPFRAWRYRLFHTTQAHLDPRGGHLDYASKGITAGYDPKGVEVGIKMGWTVPGESGQGMVQVMVSTQPGTDQELCALTGGFECSQRVVVDGQTMQVGELDGTYVVLHRQPDGDRIIVLVDPLFGNNTNTPVSRLGFDRRDVYGLVQDTSLNLPRP